jgi:hypothetical protein
MDQVASPPLLAYEIGLREAGYHTIVGLDEVGRGALAGPIVAAAVVLPPDVSNLSGLWNDVCDSKTLTPMWPWLLWTRPSSIASASGQRTAA